MSKSGVIVVIGAMFLLVVGVWTPEQHTVVIAAETSPASFSTPQSYTGSTSCRQCHEKFYQLWAPSHHGLAMQPYTAELARNKLTPQTEDIVIGDSRYRADIAGDDRLGH